MSEIFTVIGTLSGTVLGVFLTKLIKWFNKPRLEIMFECEEPCLFLGRYFRLKVINRGRSVARNCVAKFSFTEADREDWREGEMLHWTRHDPFAYGKDPKRINEIYAPITIASRDYELLDVFYIESKLHYSEPPARISNILCLYSFPWFVDRPGLRPKISSATSLDRYRIKESIVYKGKITVFCDNADPKTFLFYFKFEKGQLYVGMHPQHLNLVKKCVAQSI